MSTETITLTKAELEEDLKDCELEPEISEDEYEDDEEEYEDDEMEELFYDVLFRRGKYKEE